MLAGSYRSPGYAGFAASRRKGVLVRGKHRNFVLRRNVRAAVGLAAGAALTVGAASLLPQPVAAADGHAPAAGLAIGLAAQRHLLVLYAAYRHVPASSITPAGPGQVLGARLASSGTDWAMVHWQPSARAGQTAAAGFQDGGGTGVFIRRPGAAWTVAGLGGQPAG
jgi:hypothetical protein